MKEYLYFPNLTLRASSGSHLNVYKMAAGHTISSYISGYCCSTEPYDVTSRAFPKNPMVHETDKTAACGKRIENVKHNNLQLIEIEYLSFTIRRQEIVRRMHYRTTCVQICFGVTSTVLHHAVVLRFKPKTTQSLSRYTGSEPLDQSENKLLWFVVCCEGKVVYFGWVW